MALTTDQQRIYEGIIADISEVQRGDIFAEHSFLSITGPAGTGKTFLSKSIVESLMAKNMTCAVLAPTHQAVGVIKDSIGLSHNNLHFATVHAFLGLKPGDIDPKTGERKFKKNTGKNASPLSKMKVDIVILDESSMIGAELYKFIKKEIFELNRIKAILFLGDKFQLPAVEPENGSAAISSVIYDNRQINHYELTELIRNSDMEVIEFVSAVREMIEKNQTKYDLFNYLVTEREKEHNKIVFYDNRKEFVRDFIQAERLRDTSDCIVTFTNAKVDDYNAKIRDYYVKKEHNDLPEVSLDDLFVVQSGGEDFMNSEVLELKTVQPKEFNFKGKIFQGFYCVTKDGRHFNHLSKNSVGDYEYALALLKENAIRSKDRGAWMIYYELIELFLEVKYHYAMTIHKSQGSSYNDIWIDCTNLGYVQDQMLLRLFYVAATRAKNKVHILI